MHFAVFVGVHNACGLAFVVMLNLEHLRVRPNFEVTGGFAFRDFHIKRGPFCARFTALEAETDLLAGAAPVARF